jgi:putative transposase
MWQRLWLPLNRNVRTAVSTSNVRKVVAMLKAIHAQEEARAATQKAKPVAANPGALKLSQAADIIENGMDEGALLQLPMGHWRCLRNDNHPLERLMRGIRRGCRLVVAFPKTTPLCC